MEEVLAELKVADPTTEAAEDEILADGVTSQAAEQQLRHDEIKKEKKEKKKEKKRLQGTSAGAEAEDGSMDIDGGVPLRVKEQKRQKMEKDKKERKAKKEKKLQAMMA
jgi:hypothetical protein